MQREINIERMQRDQYRKDAKRSIQKRYKKIKTVKSKEINKEKMQRYQ